MNENKINSHYLSISYKSLINKNIIHAFLFLVEMALIFLQILEIYYYNFKSSQNNNKIYFSPLDYLTIKINKITNVIKAILYPIIIIIILITSYVFNSYRLKINIITIIMINISEILFYRLFPLILFNYLFIFKRFYLIINIAFTIPYILSLVLNFTKNHLFLFFPNLINYPYDTFSMIIDLHLLFIKLFLSLSKMGPNQNISKFNFILSISFIFVLLFYLSYIMMCKSYYLMNNIILNTIRYSIILSVSISIIIILFIDKNKLFHIYFIIAFCNIFILCLVIVCYFYDPYKFAKFEKDDNIENVYYYFFMFDRDKNQYFLIEEKIEDHISKCNMCNLCKKFNNIKNSKDKENIDLFKIIYNGNDNLFNLINNILRKIKKNDKKSFINNSYFLINIIYTFCMAINQKNDNILINIELLFEIINSDNQPILEENNISLGRIKFTNDFLLKANQVIQEIYDILEEKWINIKIKKFFKLGDEIEKLKYNDIKSNINNNFGVQNFNDGNIEGLPNCSNLLTICSLFYEEFFNEIISNSGISIRDNPNILEDLINNNYKTNKQITLEIDILSFEVKIIRAGGKINKYENKNFFDFFLNLCKNNQIFEMKEVLLNSNNNSDLKAKKSKKKSPKLLKGIEKEKQYLNFNFLIEENENNQIFCNLLKLKLSLILSTHINNKIYLNGIYILDNDIIITEETKNEEYLLFFGNRKQIKNYLNKTKIINTSNKNTNNNNNTNNNSNINYNYDANNKIKIKKIKNEKYLGNERLVKSSTFSLTNKNYNIYHFLITKKQSIYKITNINNDQMQMNNLEEEQMNLLNKVTNKTFLFNDLASHASSGNNSVGRNTLISYNRENKKVHKNENETKELKIIKYVLFLIIVIFLICMITLSFTLTKSYNKLKEIIDFYLSFKDYSNIFYNLFFSALSLGCIAESKNSTKCTPYLSDITSILYANISEEVSTSDLQTFIDKYLLYQNQLLTEDLNNKFINLVKSLSKFQGGLALEKFNTITKHYKINQVVQNKTELSLKTEYISFNDFNLLIISRFSSLVININDTYQPIYILNKTGPDVFNNIFPTLKLSSYQENFYLIILDFKKYSEDLNSYINEVSFYFSNNNSKLKNSIYFFINFVLFFVIIIFIMLFLLIFIYLVIMLKTINKINNELNEKINSNNNISIKEIMKNKIDNLKLLLKFHYNDINKTIYNLNKIYDDYRDSYNLKIKEELKLLKKEGKKEIEKEAKTPNFVKLVSTIKKYKLYKYSFRKRIYLYMLIFIVIMILTTYFINLYLWIEFFAEYNKSLKWNLINENIILATNKLISNYLLMIYDNQTLEEISDEYESKDFISYIFNELGPLYSLAKFGKYKSIIDYSEKNYNCFDFFNNYENEISKKLKEKFADEKNKFNDTFDYFCSWSGVFSFKNYKTIYLQLFSLVQKGMEIFNNIEYSNIIEFINNKDVIKIDLIYLTIYSFLLDSVIKNYKKIFLSLTEYISYYLIVTNAISYPLIFLLIFIIFFAYVRNVDNDCKKFIHIKNIFKVCNAN